MWITDDENQQMKKCKQEELKRNSKWINNTKKNYKDSKRALTRLDSFRPTIKKVRIGKRKTIMA